MRDVVDVVRGELNLSSSKIMTCGRGCVHASVPYGP